LQRWLVTNARWAPTNVFSISCSSFNICKRDRQTHLLTASAIHSWRGSQIASAGELARDCEFSFNTSSAIFDYKSMTIMLFRGLMLLFTRCAHSGRIDRLISFMLIMFNLIFQQIEGELFRCQICRQWACPTEFLIQMTKQCHSQASDLSSEQSQVHSGNGDYSPRQINRCMTVVLTCQSSCAG
jgi:hypothetical protein